jgi:hypothetical protein
MKKIIILLSVLSIIAKPKMYWFNPQDSVANANGCFANEEASKIGVEIMKKAEML